MAGEELDRRANTGDGRMGTISGAWPGVGVGNEYSDNWACNAGGLAGGTGMCGNG